MTNKILQWNIKHKRCIGRPRQTRERNLKKDEECHKHNSPRIIKTRAIKTSIEKHRPLVTPNERPKRKRKDNTKYFSHLWTNDSPERINSQPKERGLLSPY